MADALSPLAEWVAALRLSDVPPEVVADAKHQLLDCVGVIVGGATAGPVAALAGQEAGGGVATFIGRAETGSAEAAALVNGSAGTWLDFDSGQRYSGSHPAIHAVPAAIAIAEETGASGEELLAAIVAGCEVGARIGVAAGKLRAGMSPHGGWAVLGAAAAAAKLLGYDAEAIMNTLNIASSMTLMSSITVHNYGANVRHLQAGFGARNGVMAARFHEDGITGEPDGAISVFGGFVTPSFTPRRATIDLGKSYEFTRGYYKPHACARMGHAAIDALLAIRDQRPDFAGNPYAVSSVEVVTYGGAAGLNDKRPTRELGAKFSLPHTLAAAWIYGDAGPARFTLDAIADPAIRAMAERVSVREDTDYTALAPEYRPANVTVTFGDGSSAYVERLNARGENDDPDRAEWLVEKFLSLTAPRLGVERAAELHDAIMRVQELEEARQLAPLWSPGA